MMDFNLITFIPSLGGIILMIGAFFLYWGKIQYSVIAYFFADLCWLYMAFHDEDYFGVFFIIIGILLGILVFLKMHTGVFVKDLKKSIIK